MKLDSPKDFFVRDLNLQPTNHQEPSISVKDEEEEEEGEVTEIEKWHEQAMDTMETLQEEWLGTSKTEPSAQCETCNFIPHPTEIKAVVCCLCGHEKNPCDSIVWYNDNRHQFLFDRKAFAISAKLCEPSRALVAALLKPPGNEMDCASSSAGITLVEGLMEWSIQLSSPLLQDIQQTVQNAPALEIVGSRCIPTSDGELSGRVLVVIDVRPDPRLASVLYEASQQSLLAQYPLYVPYLLVPYVQVNAIAERVNVLVGRALFLDATSVTVQPAA